MFQKRDGEQEGQAQQPAVNPPMGFGRWILFGLIVVVPGVLVCVGSIFAIPDGWWMSVGLVGIMIGVGALFTYYSDVATAKIKRYCVIAHFVCMMVLAGNLAIHLAVVRDVSAVNQTVAAKEKKDQHDLHVAREKTDLAIKFNESQKELVDAQANADKNEAVKVGEYRRAGVKPPQPKNAGSGRSTALSALTLTPTATPTPTPEPQTVSPSKYKTVEEVYEAWRMALMIYSFIDAFTGIFFGGLLAARWEWDRNHDGIDDRFQQPGKAVA